MLVVRPVQRGDLEALVKLSQRAGFGLTTLPPDPEVLERRIADSLRGFSRLAEKPGAETYLLVLEDPHDGVVGTAGLTGKVGGFEPFYAYTLKEEVHHSQSLGKRLVIPTLHLMLEHNGPSEIGSLFLAEHHRKGSNGRLLSLSRFLFIADHPRYFDETVLAEMRGRIDAQGGSPFWEAVGRHFFDMEFPHADSLVMRDKRFLAELMPRHPIYVPLLPQAAQAVISQVHPDSAPALKLLESEGFSRNGMIDIFEGGPVVSCKRDAIRTVRESELRHLSAIAPESHGHQPYLISNTLTHGFRACVAHPNLLPDGGVTFSHEAATALQVEPGDTLRFATLRAGGKEHG